MKDSWAYFLLWLSIVLSALTIALPDPRRTAAKPTPAFRAPANEPRVHLR